MTVGRIDKTATCVWSPPDQRCAYLAMGTVAGAFDATFSTATELEMYRLNDDHLELTGSISTASRVSVFGWGDRTMISEKQVHQGDVKGLDVNPFQPHVVVSGGSNASILVWDLNNLDKQMTPGSTSQKLEDITYLEWNKQVPHILASGSNNGFSVIWDLKNKREVIQLANPTGRRAITALAWNPNNATQLLTACDDDNSPVIYSWDLRNAHAPEKVLSGHSKGVLSLSWCPKDSELLLSSAKDNTIIAWNPATSEQIGNLPSSRNWTFDVQWYSRNPDLVSCSSFDGKVEVYSLQTFMKGGNSKEESDPFAVSSEGRLKQTPRWFKRPIGATFSMNGQIVLFSNKNVKWKFLKLMFERDPRQRLLHVLGFEKKKVEKKETEVKGGEGDVNEVKRVEGDVNGNEEKHNDIVATSFDKLNLFGNEIEFEAQPQLLKKVNDKPFKLFKGDGVEDEITRSIIMGDLSEAVEELIRQDKWSDALVLSVCSGADTLIETQKRYFERYSEQTSYMRL
ncbi:WD40 repeat-like protein, partial [Rozella allomycis CSF55]